MRNRIKIAFQVGVHDPVVSFRSTGRRLGAARPCSPDSVGTRSCAPRSPARRSAPALPGAPSAPPGRAPSESPRALFFAPQLADPVAPNRLRAIASFPQRPRQLFQVRFQVSLELGHRHMIHARRSVVGLHASEGLPQIRQGADLVHQAVPLTSPHSLFESRQHPFRPNLGFDPGPSSPNLSGGNSPASWHSVRGCLSRFIRHVSTFLRSLRSMAVTPLPRYYGRCDSCLPPLFSALPRRRGRLFGTQVSLIHATGLPTILSPTTCGCSVSPRHVSCRWIGPRWHPSLGYAPSGNSGLRLQIADSPLPTGRIEFLIVRTGRSSPAAPHPVSRRRSCRRFQVTLTWRGLSPLRSVALSGALSPGRAGGFRL